MTQFQIRAHGITTQIQVTVFHADIIAAVCIILNRKRRSHGSIQNVQFGNDNFNVSCRNVCVLAETFIHCSCDLNDELTTQFIGTVAKFSINFFIKNQLGDTVTVAKVNESHTSHFTAALYPSRQRDLFIYIGDSQFSTCVRSEHIF